MNERLEETVVSRVYNFSAGPAVLPESVLKEAAYEMMDYQGSGMSVMEMSHRSKLYQSILDTGVDCLNPLEVKAGMDAKRIKAEYGARLVLHGGINAVNWSDPEAILAEIQEKVPVLKENGGYIFGSDHSIPNDVSLENMKIITDAAKRIGSY